MLQFIEVNGSTAGKCCIRLDCIVQVFQVTLATRMQNPEMHSDTRCIIRIATPMTMPSDLACADDYDLIVTQLMPNTKAH